ncbi:hypothetical protein GCM10010212_01810 [Paenarthrobacter nicotinovorans]|nr:hypothetical protein GCM10010212_01810 [Paenarthrobacter nicotinovorans]
MLAGDEVLAGDKVLAPAGQVGDGRSAPMTVAPEDLRRLAVASPIPLAAPMTRQRDSAIVVGAL